MVSYPNWFIDSTPLVDSGQRWFIKQDKNLTPGSWGQQFSTTTVAGRDGTLIPKQLFLSEGAMSVTMYVTGRSRAEVLANQSQIMALFRWGKRLRFMPDKDTSFEIDYVVKSATATYLAEDVNEVLFSLVAPYPVWESVNKLSGSLTITNISNPLPLPEFAGCSGPIRLAFNPEGLTDFKVTCVNSGEVTSYQGPAWSGGWLADWNSGNDTQRAGIDSIGRVHPDSQGNYAVTITANSKNVSVKWEGKKAWL